MEVLTVSLGIDVVSFTSLLLLDWTAKEVEPWAAVHLVKNRVPEARTKH